MPGRRKRKTQDQLKEDKSSKKTKTSDDGKQPDSGTSIIVLGGDEAPTEDARSSFNIPSNDKDIICERRGNNGIPELIFTHGAGGGISNPATASFVDGFSKISPVVCFQGTMNLRSRVKTFHAVIEHEDASKALGGRSMGARAAVITALESEVDQVKDLVLVSYPLVGTAKGDVRDAILKDLGDDVDVLFIMGSGDSMCDIAHLNEVRGKMSAGTWLVEVEGADHGMSLKDNKGIEAIRQHTGVIAAKWLHQRSKDETYCTVTWDKGR